MYPRCSIPDALSQLELGVEVTTEAHPALSPRLAAKVGLWDRPLSQLEGSLQLDGPLYVRRAQPTWHKVFARTSAAMLPWVHAISDWGRYPSPAEVAGQVVNASRRVAHQEGLFRMHHYSFKYHLAGEYRQADHLCNETSEESEGRCYDSAPYLPAVAEQVKEELRARGKLGVSIAGPNPNLAAPQHA